MRSKPADLRVRAYPIRAHRLSPGLRWRGSSPERFRASHNCLAPLAHSSCPDSIGANSAIFTLVDAILVHNLPVNDPKTLIRIGDKDDCCANGGWNDEGTTRCLPDTPVSPCPTASLPSASALLDRRTMMAGFKGRVAHDTGLNRSVALR